MRKILIISTGGTFNKVYDSINGGLLIDKESKAIEDIASKWLCEFEIVNIIGKDSLEMTNQDRLELLATLNLSEYNNIIIIHGTDTMHTTAEYLADADLEKRIVLTGAMMPYSIDSVEATANFSSAYGYLQTLTDNDVYIVMNGVFGSYKNIQKDRTNGRFIVKKDSLS
ncbi:MAG: asparaginase [Epsilonproteobacteria bacterium (ex Lamellibrachia satsuma)]|nr:MAG: asparaginase [Epsilonproteobacteria bacterium (ex Lamellibrachia satsuma)]